MSSNIEFTTADGLTKIFDGLSPKWLGNLRSRGHGPRYFKRGRRVFYRVQDVRLWIMANEVETADQRGEHKN